ncbi:hypothetical protein Nepgr_019170 [Nepenthes gracilis]|uniref:Uncharacterized protein n=1 Tax=Nepenthes gracilis TaxID=150966 RepID=A0AAD3SVD3_NEPGR|nr:hypothetical protein Nepgr_019170 [Nepenthes gracilis]
MRRSPTLKGIDFKLAFIRQHLRHLATCNYLTNCKHATAEFNLCVNMGGWPELDNHMIDSLQNFDLSSGEVKQQFGEFQDVRFAILC